MTVMMVMRYLPYHCITSIAYFHHKNKKNNSSWLERTNETNSWSTNNINAHSSPLPHCHHNKVLKKIHTEEEKKNYYTNTNKKLHTSCHIWCWHLIMRKWLMVGNYLPREQKKQNYTWYRNNTFRNISDFKLSLNHNKTSTILIRYENEC